MITEAGEQYSGSKVIIGDSQYDMDPLSKLTLYALSHGTIPLGGFDPKTPARNWLQSWLGWR